MSLKQIIKLDKATSDAEIAEFERKLNIQLPSEYRTFLLTNNVCEPVPNLIFISKEQGEGEVRYFLGFSDKNYFSLDWFVDIYKDKGFPRITAETIPIGIDSGGNLYCIVTQRENYGAIFFWDHDWENEGNPDNSNMYLLASSFSDFLDHLHEGNHAPLI